MLPKKTPNIRKTVYMTPDTEKKLEALKKRTGLTGTKIIEELINYEYQRKDE